MSQDHKFVSYNPQFKQTIQSRNLATLRTRTLMNHIYIYTLKSIDG